MTRSPLLRLSAFTSRLKRHTHKSKTLTGKQLVFPLSLELSHFVTPSVSYLPCLSVLWSCCLSQSLSVSCLGERPHSFLNARMWSSVLAAISPTVRMGQCWYSRLGFTFWQWVFLAHWNRPALKMEMSTGSLTVLFFSLSVFSLSHNLTVLENTIYLL